MIRKRTGSIIQIEENMDVMDIKHHFKNMKSHLKDGIHQFICQEKQHAFFLVVKNVKLEPLQDITITEIRNEGLSSMAVHAGDTEMAMAEWKSLWNGTVKKNDLNRYGWEANPWVWVIEFERIDRIVGGETNGQENSGTVHRCLCTDQGDGSGDSKVEEKERSNSGFCPGQ